mgnify:CR=1 FL=1
MFNSNAQCMSSMRINDGALFISFKHKCADTMQSNVAVSSVLIKYECQAKSTETINLSKEE